MNKLLVTLLLSSAITLSVQAQKSEGYYVKHVEFPQNATLEQKVDMAVRGFFGELPQQTLQLGAGQDHPAKFLLHWVPCGDVAAGFRSKSYQ